MILTSRRYRRVFDDRERLRDQVEEYRSLEPYFGLATEIRRRATEEAYETPEGEAQAVDQAVEWALQAERQRLIEEHAGKLAVKLNEEQKQKLRREFIANEKERIEAEVKEEIAGREEQVRRQVAQETEQELRGLTSQQLLERIRSDETDKTLERLRHALSLAAERELLIEELQAKADINKCVELGDLPAGVVINIGLNQGQATSSHPQRTSIYSCDRVMTMRIIAPTEGIFELIDDSWMSSDDEVRRHNALDDLVVLTLPSNDSEFYQPRFSKNVEPNFRLGNAEIEMFSYEVQVLTIGDEIIFD